jgi:hypothetical protein
MKPATRIPRRRLQFESLEARQLMAGNVTAAFQNGLLTITGDPASNGVRVFQRANGGFVVAGLEATFGLGPTTVNNAAAIPPFFGVQSVRIDLANGNDRAIIGQAPTAANPNPTRTDVLVDLGVQTGDGVDQIQIENTRVRDDLFADLGAGGNVAENFTVNNTQVGGFGVDLNRNNLTVLGNGGRQNATINSSTIRGFARIDFTPSPILPNHNLVNWRSVLVGDHVEIDTHAGNDRLSFSAVTVTGQNSPFFHAFSVDTGDGEDTCILDNVNLTQATNATLFADMGDANDILEIRNSRAIFFLLGGDDADELRFATTNLVRPGSTQDTFETVSGGGFVVPPSFGGGF